MAEIIYPATESLQKLYADGKIGNSEEKLLSKIISNSIQILNVISIEENPNKNVVVMAADSKSTLVAEAVGTTLHSGGWRVSSLGNVNSSVIRASEVFRPAVQANAPSIIVVHNHPSGDPAPSSQDVDITKELISAGKLLGIELLDHVVLGSANRYVSLNERRLAFQ